MDIHLKQIIPECFWESHRAVAQGCVELVELGGRGSGKSSYLSIEFLLQLLRHPDCSGAVLRKVGNTLRTSLYPQLKWAAEVLGMAPWFRFSLSPLEAEYLPTGQKILFLGMDDDGKLKSVKIPRGYLGLVWFEELDQFTPEEVRSAQLSLLRGGDWSLTLKSFNPPPDPNHWVNLYAEEWQEGKVRHRSTYQNLPASYLGERFLRDAAHLEKVNPAVYRNVYLGQCIGQGERVFPNTVLEPLDPGRFPQAVAGVDWGWWPDPWAFNRLWFDGKKLYIFDELTRHRTSNADTAKLLAQVIRPGERITADSSERKSVADYRSLGLNCRAAHKGPGSVAYSMKWLQSLEAIVIDPERCPDTAREFREARYRDGRMEGKNDHHIDAVRYATEGWWGRGNGQLRCPFGTSI